MAWVFDPHSDEEGCFGWVSGRIERLTQIGVVDRRGGEEAGEGGSLKAEAAEGAAEPEVLAVQREKREAGPIRIRRLDTDEATEDSESSLERLVFGVFFYLAALGLGFALCWYIFPHVVVMPVLVDPRTGQLIDAQTGQILAEPQDANGARNGRVPSAKADPNKSGQPASSNQSGKKEDDARPK